jgi:DNA polymerase-3 subunit gamma/tau
MSYQALARKYRPQTFRDILGQETIVRTLKNAIEQQRLHHAYLFSGVRGVGKTTTARILAKAINCVEGPTIDPDNTCVICSEITEGIDLDVREIDAATYTQVDNIRELREVSQFQPARDRRRIFIIDEAHMLSSGAWNALLKLIEEPPPHVVFIMATTEMHKVPATILSRVQQFVFRKITQSELAERLQEICAAESITADREALELISARGEGSVRDSLSVLDQIIAFSGRNITTADVINILGLSEDRFLDELMTLIHRGDHASILERLDEASDNGRDFKLLFKDLLSYVRNLLLVSSGASAKMLGSSGGNPEQLKEIASLFDATELLRILNLLMKDDEIVSRSEHQRLAVELSLLKAATLPRLRSVESVLRSDGGTLPAPNAARIAAPAAERVSPPRASAPPRNVESATEAAPAGDFSGQLVQRVSAQRRMTGGNLAQAKSIEREGSVVTITFDPAQAFAADSIREGEPFDVIKRAASELAGSAVDVKIAMGAPVANPKSDKKSAAADDPVLKSFQKHLGGEVVTRSK